MKIDSLSQALDSLNDPSHMVQAQCVNFMMNVEHLEDLKLIQRELENHPSAQLTIITIALCETLLKKVEYRSSKWAIEILTKIQNDEENRVNFKATKILSSFFSNQEIYDSFKTKMIEKVWPKLIFDQRFYLLEVIKKYKYHHLVNLIIQNLHSNNEKLKIKSLKVIKELHETRANRYIRRLIESSSDRITEQSIDNLKTTGVFFDFYYIYPYLLSSNESISKISISATIKLLGPVSLFFLKRLYNNFSIKQKEYLITEVAYMHHPLALRFLLNKLNQENDKKLLNTIQWAIYNINTPKKIQTIIKYFRKSSQTTQYRLITILSDFQDKKCFSFYREILNDPSTALFLRTQSINALVSYHDKRIHEKLNTIFKENKNTYLGYCAFKALFKANPTIALANISYIIENQNQFSNEIILLTLKYIEGKQFRGQDKQLISLFILKNMLNKSPTIQVAAIKTSTFHHNNDIFDLLIRLLTEHKNDDIKKLIALDIIKILNVFPYYLTLKNVEEIPHRLFYNIDFLYHDYRLVIHIIYLTQLKKINVLNDTIDKHIDDIAIRVNSIIKNLEIEKDTYLMLYAFLLERNQRISPINLRIMIKNYYNDLNKKIKIKTLELIIHQKEKDLYNFLTEQVFELDEPALHKKYGQYLGDIYE